MELEFLNCQLPNSSRHWIPVINGCLLHSSVDPVREAEKFVDQEWDKISRVRSLIVLGLGAGLHVAEMMRRKPFNIVVIEAYAELVRALCEKKIPILQKIEIIAGLPPGQINKESAIVEALSRSFAIVRHPASVRCAPYYYSSISQILHQRTVRALKQFSAANQPLQQFLNSLQISEEQIMTLPMVEEAMARRGSGIEKEGLIWMTMRELVV